MINFKLAQPTNPPEPRSQSFLFIPYVVAVYIAAIMLFQLLVLKDFLPYIAQSLNLQPNSPTAIIVACIILLLEFFSLPFLLRMKLSFLARATSAVFLLVILIIGIVVDSLAIEQNALRGVSGFINLLKTLVLIPLAIWAFYILNGKEVFKQLKCR